MVKKYEVTVDGETEETTRKSEATETVLEALADGETHEVSLDVIEPSAEEEVVVEGASNEDNPAAAVGGGATDAQGIAHIR